MNAFWILKRCTKAQLSGVVHFQNKSLSFIPSPNIRHNIVHKRLDGSGGKAFEPCKYCNEDKDECLLTLNKISL